MGGVGLAADEVRLAMQSGRFAESTASRCVVFESTTTGEVCRNPAGVKRANMLASARAPGPGWSTEWEVETETVVSTLEAR